MRGARQNMCFLADKNLSTKGRTNLIATSLRAVFATGLTALPILCYAQYQTQATTPVTTADKENTTPAPAAAEKPTPINILGFDLVGHVDVGYTKLSGNGKFISGLNDRVFDFDSSGAFHSLDLTLAKLPQTGFGGMLDLTIGKDADTIAAFGTIDKTRGPAAGVKKRFDVTQAFFQYATGPLTIIGGKYVTLAGAEVIKSPSDTNYSRSILFGYAIPFTHTGIRATYKMSDAISIIAGINRGWDAFQSPSGDSTIEWGISYTPSPAFSFATQGYSGKEKTFNYPFLSTTSGTRNLIDAVATYNASDKLTFILNYDYGSQANALPLGVGGAGDVTWHGVAGYANYQISEQWKLSLRGEYFDDRDGFRTGVTQKWKEATLTVAYLPAKNLELRAEARADRSSQASFVDTNGLTPRNKQQSFGIELLYKF